MESTRWSRLAVLYASTIFLSAFLLFQVQPLISRFILPWFGGGPAVWTTCLLFFQTVLFAGYAYAHFSEHFLGPKTRTVVHLALIIAALATLPITPSDGWKPADSDFPTAKILALLAVCVGLPYFVLSSTGPLVQAWFSQTLPGRSPYRLYSLSNFGSLLALLSYPFVVEPALDGNQQSLWWTAGFVVFALLCGAACWLTARRRPAAAAVEAADATPAIDDARPSALRWLLWLVLPAFASALLMATTNHVCQDMPSIPFLWVVPLSVYLLSFIIAFDHERWYRRLPHGLAALVAIYLTAGMNNPRIWGVTSPGYLHYWFWGTPGVAWAPAFSFVTETTCQFIALFLACMLCHGELVRLRPAPRYLTSFYLMISAGGALGGLSVSLVAPVVFNTYAEWKIGIVASFVMAAIVAFVLAGRSQSAPGGRKGPPGGQPGRRLGLRAAGLVVAGLALCEIVVLLEIEDQSDYAILEESRNFYGALTVVKGYGLPPNPPFPFYMLYNGRIPHGMQYADPVAKRTPVTYFSQGSGVGQTLEYYQQQSAHADHPLRVGVVGLGAGTLAAYVYRPGQTIRFYEINPAVLPVAEKYFSYLADSRVEGATAEVVLGDARLSMERELSARPLLYDVLVLDAFSGDSIPIHLLTSEAFELYRRYLAPQGALAIHISNRHVNLAPVVFGLAEKFEFSAVEIAGEDREHAGWQADWIILSRNQPLLKLLRADKGVKPPPQPPLPIWTDNRHNLFEILW